MLIMSKAIISEVVHDFLPVYNENSRILILGTMPSAASREHGFYYMHPQNRFWKVLERLFNSAATETIPQKKQLLLENNIALWDVLKSCQIQGSSDSSIQNTKMNDFSKIFCSAKIEHVYTNGKKAFELYSKSRFNEMHTAVYLPSTSPANASYSLNRLCQLWSVII